LKFKIDSASGKTPKKEMEFKTLEELMEFIKSTGWDAIITPQGGGVLGSPDNRIMIYDAHIE
jgi:adenine/guanine phosphoribosyltransferase-like PRPP-binding protein